LPHNRAITAPQLASPPAPLQGERGVICFAAAMQKNKNSLLTGYTPTAIARHTTPLSPWRGAGGEAGSGCGAVAG